MPRSINFRSVVVAGTLFLTSVAAPAVAQAPDFIAFETGPVRPLALSGTKLVAVNTPDNSLETFNVSADGITRAVSVGVGLEPCAVALRAGGTEAWVVNHLSDSVSIVDVTTGVVKRTLLVGDEPRDVVITDPDGAGPLGDRVFITTAHRGQHRTDPSIAGVPGAGDPELTTPGTPRADVWVFDADNPGNGFGGTPMKIFELFGDTPRALAVSADGTSVYAAIFHSGNQTAVVHGDVVCDNFVSSTCSGDGISSPNGLNNGRLPGGNPGPPWNAANEDAPEVGLVVQFDEASGEWRDEFDRNWSNGIRFFLPDYDVFRLNAATLDDNDTVSFAHVGTINFNMVAHPTNGKVYVSNTDAQNLTRFEGPGTFLESLSWPVETTVQGNLHQARITVLDGSNVTPVHLNSHIDYSVRPAPAGTKDHSLATPTDMVVSADGTTLYVAAFGSGKVGVIPTAALEGGSIDPTIESANYIPVSGGGPAGLALDDTNNKLYVLTRFDNSISVINLPSGIEANHIPLHNPEPASITTGRPVLYDAFLSSSNGEASCSSCHVFADFDSLAWDLGNPDGDVTQTDPSVEIKFELVFDQFPGDQSGINGTGNVRDLHPMKGPMTTQTLRGMELAGPMHWRGDRFDFQAFIDVFGAVPPGTSVERLAFKNFVVAFEGLLGSATLPTQATMDEFADFALQIRLPPNPVRNLDNSLTAAQQAGMDFYDGTLGRLSDGVTVGGNGSTCEGCHRLDASQGFFGTGTDSSFENEPQIFKIPHLRNMYQKVGMFGMPNVDFILNGNQDGGDDFSHQGDQVRGTGFIHDGSIDTLFRFFRATAFEQGFLGDNSVGFNGGNAQRSDMEALMLAFDSDLAPIVGQQVTLDDDDSNFASEEARLALLEQRAGTPFVSAVLGGVVTECDLVAKGRWNNRVRSALYDPNTDTYQFDAELIYAGIAPQNVLTATEIRTIAQMPDQDMTFTCVPPGSGVRIGLDRDGDGIWNFDELQAGTKADDPGSVLGACNDGIDNDGDGTVDLADPGCPAASANVENPQCNDGYDNDNDGFADMADPHCTDPSSNRELAPAGGDDCHAGATEPATGLMWAVMLFLALGIGARRRRHG